MWCLDGVPWSVQPRYDELRGVVSSVFPMRKVKEHDAGGCSPPLPGFDLLFPAGSRRPHSSAGG